MLDISKSELAKTVVALHFSGVSARKILDKLEPCYPGLTYYRVRNIIRTFYCLNSTPTKRDPVFRSRKYNVFQIYRIKNCISKYLAQDNEMTTKKLRQAVFKELGFDIKTTMMKRLRRSLGYVSRSVRTGHMIRDTNKMKRLQFCRSNLACKESFRDVIFADESLMQLENNSKRCLVRKGEEQRRIRSQVKHPLKVNVWGGISWEGATALAIIDGNVRVDSRIFCQIIEEFYLPFASAAYNGKCRLAQDNDPKHKSRFTSDWLDKNNVARIEWPPESPDLNPIENVWHQMREFLRNEYKPHNKEELVRGITKFWKEKMTKLQCKKYIKNIFAVMPKIVAVRGGHIAE